MEGNHTDSYVINSELLDVKNRLESTESEFDLLKLVKDIGESELLLIGELIQIYCTADALCRGLIAMLKAYREGLTSDFAYRLNDSDVLIHTKKEAEKTGLNIDKPGIALAIETLEMHRVFRHTFSHWVVKKYFTGKYLIAFTKSKTDAEKRDGAILNSGKAKMMIFRISDLKIELEKIKDHCKFLAELHRYLESNL
ncbi:hypothetical protein DBV33_12930 [Pseudomonas fluorescens]|nr:hypothetical protein DBV33_12930 [Pseudomonas fluorescens]